MRKTIKLYITGFVGTLISIALSTSCLHIPQHFSLHLLSFEFHLFSGPSQILLVLSVIFFIGGVLFSGFGYVEDKHETWVNRCALTLAPYEELLFGTAGAQTAEETRS